MQVHITNLHGMASDCVGQIAQNQVAKIARDNLGFLEMGIYYYRDPDETAKEIDNRFDGIFSSVVYGDVVILQTPTWNSIVWEEKLINRLDTFQVTKIFFIEDITPLMFENNAYLLKRYINFYNRADLVIVASEAMYQFLRAHGLTVTKYVVQKMWDHPAIIDDKKPAPFKKVINFAGGDDDSDKFKFVKQWASQNVKLRLYTKPAEWGQGKNIEFAGWVADPLLPNDLRLHGGFGLVWSEQPYWSEYMKKNSSYKLSTYLAAGIPVIVNSQTPEKETIERKNLGIIADSLDEAIAKVESMTADQYHQLTSSVDKFARLIRNGYFTKLALTEAVFKALYE